MEPDSLKLYFESRQAIIKERESLGKRLSEINEALGMGDAPADPARAPKAKAPESTPRKKKGGRKKQSAGRKNAKSLKGVLLDVLTDQPLAKEELLEKVKATGYQFRTSNPIGSVYTALHGNPTVRKVDGKYCKA